MNGVTLDAGGLIAVDKSDRRVVVRRDRIFTSDVGDLRRLDPDVVLEHV
jgi:hypothetical protein